MVVVSSSGGERHKLDARGVPSFAYPWLEMGRLEEREKWQKLAMELMETSIFAELADLRGTVASTLPGRLPELKQSIHTKVDDAQKSISQLIAQYKKFFLEEKWEEDAHNESSEITTSQSMQSTMTPSYHTYEDIYNGLGSPTNEIVAAVEDETKELPLL